MPLRAIGPALGGAWPQVVRRRRGGHPRFVVGARQSADSARGEVSDALADGRRKASGGARVRAAAGPRAVLALQRSAGNAAVSALMAAKLRSPGEQALSLI